MSANNTNMTIDELIFDHDELILDHDDEDYDEDYDENNEEFPVYLCSRDSAIARDSEGEPIPYRNATNDDLPDLNVFLKRMSLQSLNEQFDSKFALTMEDYLELEKYSYKTQLSLTDSVKYSRFCHCCNKSMGENRFKRVYCCDECEITVEVDEENCI